MTEINIIAGPPLCRYCEDEYEPTTEDREGFCSYACQHEYEMESGER